LSHEGFEYDHVFDWTVKKFNMIYGNIDQPVVPKARSSKKGNKHRCDFSGEPSIERIGSIIWVANLLATWANSKGLAFHVFALHAVLCFVQPHDP
jgi:ribosomal protein L37AE/L43A